MARLIRQDPEPAALGRKRDTADTEWSSLLMPAKKHVGVWYEIDPPYSSPGAAATAAYDIQEGRNGLIPSGRWEATSRTRWDNGSLGILFIRFLGE